MRPWPMPSTAAYTGPYLLKLEAQPRRLVESWPVRRLAAVIPGLAESIQRHATAVVEADAEYALTVLPPEIPTEKLVTALVVEGK